MPCIDLGNKPDSYNPLKSESGQEFVVPHSSYPNKMIIKYSDYKPEFKKDTLL
jgi:hypothetical protein